MQTEQEGSSYENRALLRSNGGHGETVRNCCEPRSRPLPLRRRVSTSSCVGREQLRRRASIKSKNLLIAEGSSDGVKMLGEIEEPNQTRYY
jgi:hypothetical protein